MASPNKAISKLNTPSTESQESQDTSVDAKQYEPIPPSNKHVAPDLNLRKELGAGTRLPMEEQAKDVLLGEKTTFTPPEPEIDIFDRLAANTRRLRGGSSSGAKPMLRRLFMTKTDTGVYAMFTVAELCRVTGKGEVNIRTCLTDLRSPKFAGKDGPCVTITVKKEGLTFYMFDEGLTAAAIHNAKALA